MTTIQKLSQVIPPVVKKVHPEYTDQQLGKFLKGLEPKADKFTRSAPSVGKGTKGVSPEYLDKLSRMLGSDKPVVPPVENTISNPPQELPKDFLRFLK